jgi:hypothetical protein
MLGMMCSKPATATTPILCFALKRVD